MARQKGLIKIKGTLDDLTFYRSQDGYIVKTKTSLDGERIASDPAFARTRENVAEFINSAHAGKMLRDTVRTMMLSASDNRVTSRLTKLMSVIKNMDSVSARGERTVANGIINIPAKELLKGFNFNNRAILSSILFAPFTVNNITGVITFPTLTPTNDVMFPEGATHLSLGGAWARVDFATGTSDIQYTNKVNLLIDGTTAPQTLTPTAIPSGTGTDIYLLEIDFFQEVNNIQYTLKNGAFNALAIVEVV